MNFSPIAGTPTGGNANQPGGGTGANQGPGGNQQNMKVGNFLDISPNSKCSTSIGDVSTMQLMSSLN